MIEIKHLREVLTKYIAIYFDNPEDYLTEIPIQLRPEILIKEKIPSNYIEEISCLSTMSLVSLIGRIDDDLDEFEMDDIAYQDEDLYYIINARGPKKGIHDAQMLIRERDFAIFQITIFWKPENLNNFSWAWESREEEEFYCDWQQSVYEYNEIDGQMYPKRSSWHRKGLVRNKLTKEVVFETESIDELLITNVDLGKFPFENKVPVYIQNIYEMAEYFPYQKEFWDTFNRPVDSEYFKKAKSRMESFQPLEEQFQSYSGLKFVPTN